MTQAAKRFPCPSCGGTLEFNPKQDQLKCPYCGRTEQIPKSADEVVERSYEEYLHLDRAKLSMLANDALEVACPGCRAQLTFEPPLVANQCPFCATPIVAQGKTADPTLAPEAILPFAVDKKAAQTAMQQWLKNLWFAPTALKKMAQPEGIQGVYLPFWTYDSFTRSHYSGERGEYYYTTETYTETNDKGQQVRKTRQVRHTRWYPARGSVERFFDDVLVCASEAINRGRVKALWQDGLKAAELRPYDEMFLTGFKAQRYQIPLKEGFELAKTDMDDVIRGDIRRDIGGDEQRISTVNTSYSAITFKHILLPLWISAYRFKQKQYQVMINGKTGKVFGDRPYSIFQITMVSLGAAGIIALVYYLANR